MKPQPKHGDNEPDNDKIAEILNNGIIGLQDRIDTLNDHLDNINKNLEHILHY